MIENELIALWQSSPNHERIKFEKSRFMLDVQSSLERFDRAIKYRDLMEIGAAITMIPFFAYQAYRLPNMLSKIGAIMIVIWCAYVIYRLLKVKKTKPNEVDSYLEYLKQNKEYLEKQKKLLEKVLYWYILPCLTGCVMIMIGTLNLFGKPFPLVAKMAVVWICSLIFIAVGVCVYLLNKRAVKKEFLPRIKKVNELISLMESDSTAI
ncbi:MAG: hypothetical protein AB3N18_14730 [Allomuricauda sp.]